MYNMYYLEMDMESANAECPVKSFCFKVVVKERVEIKNILKDLKYLKYQLNFLSCGSYELKIQPRVVKSHKTYKLLNSLLISFFGSFKNCLSFGLLLCAEIMCPRQKVNCSR